MTLDTLEIGKDAIVSSVDCEEKSLRQHIFDMGLTLAPRSPWSSTRPWATR